MVSPLQSCSRSLKGPGEAARESPARGCSGRASAAGVDGGPSSLGADASSAPRRMTSRPLIRSLWRSRSSSDSTSLFERLMSSMSRTWTGVSAGRRISLARGLERLGGSGRVLGERRCGVVREVLRRRCLAVATRTGRDSGRCVEGWRMGWRKVGLGRGKWEVWREVRRRGRMGVDGALGLVFIFFFGGLDCVGFGR